jgi:large repetitive protein
VDGAAVSDDAGDDVGEVVGNGVVTVRVGEGADASTGGRVGVGTSTTLTFDVTVDEAAAGSVIDNTGRLAYRAVTLEQDLTTPTNTVLTPVAADEPATPPTPGRPVLQVSQAAPERVPAGEVLHYDFTVRNKGDADAVDSTATFTLPPGVTVVKVSDGCRVDEAVLTCDLGTLSPGDVWFGELDVRVNSDAAPETALNSTGQATASGAEPAESSVRTRVSGDSSLSVQVEVTPSDPGAAPEPVGLEVVVTNDDTGTGSDVTALVVIPPGWTLHDGDHGCEVNTDHPEVASCQLGDVVGGGSSSLSLTVTPGDDASGDGEVFVKVKSSQLDRQPSDNVVTQSLSADGKPEELPATGSDAQGWLLAALALVLLGWCATAVRRRTASHLG